MRFAQLVLCSGLALATAVPGVAVIHARRGPTAHHKTSSRSHKRSARPVKKTLGQRSIDDSRAAQIQAALVKSGYLTVPSGHWDSDTSAAMQKFQADNGWQTKLVPDSRAIIKLGLGPDHEGDRATLNSGQTESASTSSATSATFDAQ
ncbi:MAG: peptidoglycan-binding protein [Acidobacteriales bacterium]|nr:peptidoglycan-binding protein [Terriglobales bacterium]